MNSVFKSWLTSIWPQTCPLLIQISYLKLWYIIQIENKGIRYESFRQNDISLYNSLQHNKYINHNSKNIFWNSIFYQKGNVYTFVYSPLLLDVFYFNTDEMIGEYIYVYFFINNGLIKPIIMFVTIWVN